MLGLRVLVLLDSDALVGLLPMPNVRLLSACHVLIATTPLPFHLAAAASLLKQPLPRWWLPPAASGLPLAGASRRGQRWMTSLLPWPSSASPP